ncbi:hypothetical protein F511_29571 [Dorcoceras hygrometricum]|uniref:Uncharacterized protein n=1 Tax=Dorcoceras hygrometricum TaxID=472368 RepID=A0A2Z7C4P0_9LAMI|nr:hypothetical protein F511_29571 [Dorcoceras hygrometricum]
MKSIKKSNRTKVTRSERSLLRWMKKSDRSRFKLIKEKSAQSIKDRLAMVVWYQLSIQKPERENQLGTGQHKPVEYRTT